LAVRQQIARQFVDFPKENNKKIALRRCGFVPQNRRASDARPYGITGRCTINSQFGGTNFCKACKFFLHSVDWSGILKFSGYFDEGGNAYSHGGISSFFEKAKTTLLEDKQ